MPLRSLLLMLCCQNPKFEDDLESLNQFIKTMRESVQGMRASVNAFHTSAAEFQKAMLNKETQESDNFSTQPYQEPTNNFHHDEENIDDQPAEQSESTQEINQT